MIYTQMTVGKITRGGDAMTSGTLYLYPAKMWSCPSKFQYMCIQMKKAHKRDIKYILWIQILDKKLKWLFDWCGVTRNQSTFSITEIQTEKSLQVYKKNFISNIPSYVIFHNSIGLVTQWFYARAKSTSPLRSSSTRRPHLNLPAESLTFSPAI